MADQKNMTTYEQFIESNPIEKAKFEKEYQDFLFSEFILETMESQHLTVRALAQKAGVSPTVIQKIRGPQAEKINLRTLKSVLASLGYKIRVEKMNESNKAGTIITSK